MSNTSYAATPSDDTRRMIALFHRRWAAERSEREYQASLPAEARSTRPRSPHLKLEQDIRAAESGQLTLTDLFPQLLQAPSTTATPAAITPTTSSTASRWWDTLTHRIRSLLLHWKAMMIFTVCGGGTTLVALQAYANTVRARPTSAIFANAPLPRVVAELRHRTGLDIRLCRIPSNTPPITVTLSDTPIETILDQIATQSDLYVHWWWSPTTVLIQPRINLVDDGAAYNIKTFLMNYTTIGCHQ